MRFSRFLLPAIFCLGCDPQAAPQTGRDASSSTGASASPTSSSKPQPTSSTSSTTPSATATTPEVPAPPKDAVAKLAASSNQFGFDLYKKLGEKNKGNLVISPASLTTALAMTWGGAKGETEKQMRKALHLSGTTDEVMDTSGKLAQSLTNPSRSVVFRIANRLFGEKTYGFEKDYLDRTKKAYGAPLEQVDFVKAAEPARTLINGWVEEKTEKRIKDLIPPKAIDTETRLVLVNAIYFLGDWDEPFEKQRTQPGPFQLGGGKTKEVPMMNRTDGLKIGQLGGATALELPYKGGEMSMVLVVPDKVDGLAALEKSLDDSSLNALLGSMKSERVWASIPKFEINPSESLALKELLIGLGMTEAFDRRKADFTGIANPSKAEDRLVISQVFHKGFIRVDEQGTEAAAATAVVQARAGAAPMKPREFKADRPFMFFIRDNASGLTLFMGRVTEP
jgi:serpin B